MLCAKNATDPKLAESRRTFLAIDEGGATHRAFEDLPAACHGDDGPFISLKCAYQRTTKKFTELLSQFFQMPNKLGSDPGVSAQDTTSSRSRPGFEVGRRFTSKGFTELLSEVYCLQDDEQATRLTAQLLSRFQENFTNQRPYPSSFSHHA
jgi:hypothetical protein